MSPDSLEPSRHVEGFWRRQTAALFRWLHIYLSMVSFAILFFFAVTGFTLNHADWFSRGKEHVRQARGKLDSKWTTGSAESIKKLEIAEYLRATHAIKGMVSEFRVEEAQCSIAWKGPGYTADATIQRDTGDYELTETRMGFVAVVNDLHKGRDSGHGWSIVIDLAAIMMMLVSITGTVLLTFLKRRRFAGWLAACAGAFACWLVYVLFVP